MESILLKNGLVIDGLGGPGRRADVLLKDGRVAEIGSPAGGSRVIDAEGCIVCPGFVDIHRHCDAKDRKSVV